MTLMLRHTGTPFDAGTVLASTHLDFPLGVQVKVAWPLGEFPVVGTRVVLDREARRYLALWTAQDADHGNDRTYAVGLRLPNTRPLL